MWKVFYLLIFISVIKTAGDVMGVQLEEKYLWFKMIYYGIPGLLLALHSILTLSPKRVFLFVLLASGTGAIMEYFGLKIGAFFGGHYVYSPQITLITVPIKVIVYWAIFIYTGYCIVTSFLYWLKQKKPTIKTGNYLLLLFTVLLDGLVVVALDLFLDPIAVRAGEWKWLEGGPYFGVPIGNFIGWLLVVVIATGIFRSIEYFFPIKEMKYNKSVLIIPVLGYGLLAVSFLIKAVRFQMFDLALVGSLLMFPIVFLNLYFYIRHKI